MIHNISKLQEVSPLAKAIATKFGALSCSSFKPDYQELPNPCSATILVATDTQFKGVTAYLN
ncbi:MAG TPA: hypothetical protein V6D48_13460 [Oculatellaceae cyanobacterium]